MLKNFNRVAAATAALLCAPMAAHADPITSAIGVIATSLSSLSASTVLTGLATMALNYGASMLLGKMMQKDVKEKGVKGKLESGGDLPLSFILGEYATAGKLIYVNEYSGDLNSILVMVVSLSEMPVTSLSSFLWVNGEKTSIDFASGTDSNGFYVVPRYQKYDNDYLKVKFYDGTQTTADAFLTSTFGSDPDKPWSSDMIGRGCAYAILQCKYSRKGVWSGIPEFKFVLRGMKLYNPAKDSTNGGSGAHRWNDQSTWEWSENPVVMKYNIIRGIYYKGHDWIFGGQNLSAYQLPSAYWIAAINHCDETVTKADSTTVKRYTAGCEISVDQQPIDIIKELDKSCAGYTSEYGGVWKTWAGAPGSSVFSFTDADIIITEEQEDDLFRPIQELYNGVRATYTSPNQGWVSKDAPPRIFSDYETADGYSLIAEISFPFVTEPNQVQRLMRAAVLDSRKQITHQLRMPPNAYLLDVRDVVSWTSTRNGYSAKKFLVIAIEDMPDFTQFVTLREVDPTDYDWNTEYELEETTGPLVEVKPGALAVDFTVTADQIDNDNGGKDRPAIKVEWDWQAPDLDIRHIEYEIRRSGTTKVIKRGTFKNVMRDTDHVIEHSAFRFGKTYQIRFYPEPLRAWRDTSWTSWKSVKLFDIDVPGRPTLEGVSDIGEDGRLDYSLNVDWTAVQATATYTVRFVRTLNGVTKTFYRTSDTNSFTLSGVTPGSSFVVSVRAKVGPEVGDWSDTRSITINKRNTAPDAPTDLTVTGGYKAIYLSWTESTEKDFKRVNIYRASSNDFTAASLVARTSNKKWTDDDLGNNVTRYYWITFENTSLSESSKFPVSNTGGRSATTSKLSDDDMSDGSPAVPNDGSQPSYLVRSDVNEDGGVDLRAKISWTAIGNTRASYYLRVYDSRSGGYTSYEVPYGGSSTVDQWIPVNSGVEYTVSVAAITVGRIIGNFTSNRVFTPSKKATLPTTPSGLTVTPAHKRNKLKWTLSPDADYKETVIWRSTTNDFTTASEVDRKTGRSCTDDGLTNGTTYYYWITHIDRTRNESAKHPSSNTAGVSGTPGYIADSDTDATAPFVPSGLALVQTAKDVDEDGKVDIAIKATWSAASGAKSYELEITQGSDVTYLPSKARNRTFKAKSGKLYSVKVSAISFNGTQSAFSSAVTLTPVKKSDLPTTATGLTATARAKGIRLKWTKCPDADYDETIILRGGAEIARTSGNSYLDSEELTVGSSYSYTVQHVDRSGNVGAASSSASATYRAATSGDIGTGAVTGGNLAANTVSASNMILGDFTNRVENPNFGEGNVGWVLGNGCSIVNDSANAYLGNYYLALTVGAVSIAARNSNIFPVVPGEKYLLEVVAKASDTLSHTVSPRIRFMQADKSTLVTASGLFSFSATDTTYTSKTAEVTVPMGAVYAWVDFVPASTLTAGTLYVGFVSAKRKDAADLVVAGTLTDDLHDQTAPGVVSAPSLTLRQKVDGDGRVATKYKVTWTAPASTVPIRYYEIAVTNTTDGDVDYFKTKNLSKVIDVVVGNSYTFSVSAISMFGIASAFTNSTSATPAVISNSVPTPTWITASGTDQPIQSKPKSIQLRWVKPSGFKSYKETIVYRNTTNSTGTAVEVGRGSGTRFKDDDELVAGTTYYYWLKHMDNSENIGASFSTVQSVVYRGASLVDLNINDPSSMAENNDLSLGPYIGWGTPANIVLDATNAYKGSYVGVRTYSGAASSFANRNKLLFPVRPGEKYYIGGMVKTSSDVAGSTLSYGYRLSFCTDVGGGTEVAVSTVGVSAINTDWTSIGGIITVPSTATIAFARIEMFVYNQTAGSVYWSHCYVRPAVMADMTDNSVPAVVSAPTLTLRQSLDGDGAVNSKIKVTWSAPSSAVAIAAYEIRINDGTDTVYKTTKNLSYMIAGAVVGKTYTVAVSAISKFGVASTFDNTAALTVTKRSASLPAVGTVTLTASKKRIKVDWPDIDDDAYPEYRMTWVYRNTTGTAPTLGTTTPYKKTKAGYLIDDGVTTGTTYYYWVVHKDRSGGYSALSTVKSGTSAGNEVSAFADLTGSVFAGQTDSTALTAPSCMNSASSAVASAVYFEQDNQDVNGDGAVDIAMTCSWVDVTDAVRYDIEVSRANASGGPWTVTGLGGTSPSGVPQFTFKANTNKYYKVRVRARNAFGAPGSWTTNVVVGTTTTAFSTYAGFQPVKRSAAPTASTIMSTSSGAGCIRYEWDACPDEDYAYSRFYWSSNPVFGAGTLRSRDISGSSFSVLTSRNATTYGWVVHYNRSGQASTRYPAGNGWDANSGYVYDVDIYPGSIGTDQLASGAGFERATAITASAYGDFGTGTQTVQSVTLDHNGASFVEIYGEFKNISGAARTFSVTIETPTDTLRTRSCTVGPDEVITITGHEVNPSGSSTVYRLRVQSGDSTNDVRDRYLRAVSRK